MNDQVRELEKALVIVLGSIVGLCVLFVTVMIKYFKDEE